MKLEGIHHITATTADAPRNADFYVRVLGLRLVKKSINQGEPNAYHIFFGDERASPGADISFFEFRGRPDGRAGAGRIHRVVWRVASQVALDFWERRLRDEGVGVERADSQLRFADPEGLGHELAVVDVPDEPLVGEAPDVPADCALQGFDGVRAFAADPQASAALLEETLGFEPRGPERWEARGHSRGGWIAYDPPPQQPPRFGAGAVHHVAWACQAAEHEAWRQRVLEAGADPTPVIDRHYFHSVYFGEPSGVLFEIATLGGPGFTVDEDLERLGETLSLPPELEGERKRLGMILTPVPTTRELRGRAAGPAGEPRPAAVGGSQG